MKYPSRECSQSIHNLVRQLQQRIADCSSSVAHAQFAPTISSGCRELDQALPAGGLVGGQLVEWFGRGRGGVGAGGGAGYLAMKAAAAAAVGKEISTGKGPQSSSVLVVIDRDQSFYPPALLGFSIDPQQVIVVRPDSHADHIWSLHQVLRCPAVAAVWTCIGKINDREFRQLQLAAEQGSVLGLLVRPTSESCAPSWADVRLLIEPAKSDRYLSFSAAGWNVSLLHSRSVPRPKTVWWGREVA